MTILDKIIADKKVEVALRKQLFPMPTGKHLPFLDEQLLPLRRPCKQVNRGLLQNINGDHPPSKTSTAPFGNRCCSGL